MRIYPIVILIPFLASCMLSRSVTISVSTFPVLPVNDSVKTVLVVDNSWKILSLNSLKSQVYDSIQKIVYKSIFKSFSFKYKVQYLVLDNESLTRKKAQQLCDQYHADLLINMQRIKITAYSENNSDYNIENVTEARDEFGNFICAFCGFHYNPVHHGPAVISNVYTGGYASSCCPICGSCDRVTIITTTQIQVAPKSRTIPFVKAKTNWIVYDRLSDKYYSKANVADLPIEERTIEEVFRTSKNIGNIISSMIFGSFRQERRLFIYNAFDPVSQKVVESLDIENPDKAIQYWEGGLLSNNRIERRTCCHNLAVYYEYIGDLKKAREYYRLEKSYRNPLSK